MKGLSNRIAALEAKAAHRLARYDHMSVEELKAGVLAIIEKHEAELGLADDWRDAFAADGVLFMESIRPQLEELRHGS
jgi:hypothetical protein